MRETEQTIKKQTKSEVWDAGRPAVSEAESIGRAQPFLDCDGMCKNVKIMVERYCSICG